MSCFLKRPILVPSSQTLSVQEIPGHPKGYNIRLVADRNHLEHPVYVGDIDGDRVASEEAGVPFCHASYGFGEVDHADYVIKNFSELKSIFE